MEKKLEAKRAKMYCRWHTMWIRVGQGRRRCDRGELHTHASTGRRNIRQQIFTSAALILAGEAGKTRSKGRM